LSVTVKLRITVGGGGGRGGAVKIEPYCCLTLPQSIFGYDMATDSQPVQGIPTFL